MKKEDFYEEMLFDKYFFRTIVCLGSFFGTLSYFILLSKAANKDFMFSSLLYCFPIIFILIQSVLRMCGVLKPKWERIN